MKALLKLVVGKNIPHIARVVVTFVGGLLLATPLFSPDTVALDPGVGSAITEIGAPSAAEVKDGLNVGELIGAGLGLVAIWVSAFVSYLRAKNYDWLANLIGPLIGRSLPSLGRRVLVILAALLARASAQPEMAPEALANLPVATALGSVLLVAFANLWSATEDAKRNPVPPAGDDFEFRPDDIPPGTL